MFARELVGQGSDIPPIMDGVVGVFVIVDDEERTTLADPGGEGFVEFGGWGFLAFVGEEEEAIAVEKSGGGVSMRTKRK